MEENVQRGEGFLMEENLEEMGISEPVTPVKPAGARPLLSIKRGVNEEKFLQNFDAAVNSTGGFEENGLNFTVTAELGDHEWTSPDSWRNVEENSRYQNYGVGMVERLDIGSMQKLLGVDHVNSKDQSGNGVDSTTSAASQGKDGGITGGGCGSANPPQNLKRSKKGKNTNGAVKRRPRMKMKKHRPKIFDVMTPKKVPKAQKKPKSEKKKKYKKEPKSEQKGYQKAKRTRMLKSTNAAKDSSCIIDPQTPEFSASNDQISSTIGSCRSLSNSEENSEKASDSCNGHVLPSCIRTLDYDLDVEQGENPVKDFSDKISSPQYKVYTRRRKSVRNMGFNLNLEVQDFEFQEELRKIVWEVKNFPIISKRRRNARQKATAFPSFLGTKKQLREMLPTVKQFKEAMMQPKSYRCVLALKPIILSRKKRSKRLKHVAAAVSVPGFNASDNLSDNVTLPLLGGIQTKCGLPSSLAIPRRKRSQTNTRRHALPIPALDFESNLYEIGIDNSPQIDLYTLPGDFEEVSCVNNQSSMKTLVEFSEVEPQSIQMQGYLPSREPQSIQIQGNLPSMELQSIQIQGYLPSEVPFHRGQISMLHYQGVRCNTMQQKSKGNDVTLNTESYHLERSLDDLIKQYNLIKRLEHLSISNNCKALVPSEGRTKKKIPKVIRDADSMKTWMVLVEDGPEKTEENYWKEQKEIFSQWVQLFIMRMHLIQGNRRFSRWKGSVVDSVVGVFLTQNVSDNLSSDAFMRLVARFPKHSEPHDRDEGMEFNQEMVGDEGTRCSQNSVVIQDEDTRFSQESVMGGDGDEGIRSSQESIVGRDVYESIRFSEEAFVVKDGDEGIRFSQESVVDADEGIRFSQESGGSNTEDNRKDVMSSGSNSSSSKYQASVSNLEEVVDNSEKTSLKRKRTITKTPKEEQEVQNWEQLRKEYDTMCKDTTGDTDDSVDWEAIRCTTVKEIADVIGKRGMHNVLAKIIKEFLNRLIEDHGKIDLEWLRNVPTEKVREYLISFNRIGSKSLDCVRLLTLYHHAFPVDTNVGRIVVRLGWVPLQPLPGVEIHDLNDYPILAEIQEYLWPRLSALDQQTLYELHYQMITFGKVFCTKRKPRCEVCPMSGSCRHFASAQRSQLPSGAQQKRNEDLTRYLGLTTPREKGNPDRGIAAPEMSLLDENDEERHESQNCQPTVEMPMSPEPESWKTSEIDIEDLCWNSKEDSEDDLFWDLRERERASTIASEALVNLAPEAASFPAPKLKSRRRLHTEHLVYVLSDDHELLAQFSNRERDDPIHYLLAIFDKSSETGDKKDDQTVLGTILIPCRTANQGRFPLNGTYFQVNEVFADYETSINPIHVPRNLLWNLPRGVLYCAPSGRSIFRDMSLLEIHRCFWNGYICVRSFNRKSREPSLLHRRFHTPKEAKNSENRKTKAEFTTKQGSKGKKKSDKVG